MARRSKILADDVRENLLGALRAGNYADDACRYAGVHQATFYRWMERGDPDSEAAADAPYREFREAVEKARADATVGAVAQIRKAAVKNWQAAAWWLERTQPAKFGRRDRVDVGGVDGAPPIRIEATTAEQRKAAQALLAARRTA